MNTETYIKLFGSTNEIQLAEINQALTSENFDIAIKYRHPGNIVRSAIISGNYKLFRDAINESISSRVKLLELIFQYNRVDWLVYRDLLQVTTLAQYFVRLPIGALYILVGIVSRDHAYTDDEMNNLFECARVLGYVLPKSTLHPTLFSRLPLHCNLLETMRKMSNRQINISLMEQQLDIIENKSVLPLKTCVQLRKYDEIEKHILNGEIATLLSLTDLLDILPSKYYCYFEPYTLFNFLCHYELYDRIPKDLLKNVHKPPTSSVENLHRYLYSATVISLTYYPQLFGVGPYYDALRMYMGNKIVSREELVVVYVTKFIAPANIFSLTNKSDYEEARLKFLTEQTYLSENLNERRIEELECKKLLHPEIRGSINTFGGLLLHSTYDVAKLVREDQIYISKIHNISVKLTQSQLDLLVSKKHGIDIDQKSLFNYTMNDDLPLIRLAEKDQYKIFIQLYDQGSSDDGYSKFKFNYMVSRMLALAFLFEARDIYSYILKNHVLSIELLEAALLEYLPAISEYSLDLLQKYAKTTDEEFSFSAAFVQAVKDADPRTYKIIEQYFDDVSQ